MKSIYTALVMLSIAFFGSDPAFAQSTTFSYTTSVIQTYTVPTGVTSLNVTAKGAQGGDYLAPTYVGGLGATMNCVIAVTPGHVLGVVVGQQGGISPYCAGGGGGTFVWDAIAATHPLVAAGGGGGATSAENGNNASSTTSGGSGGGITYEDGGTGGIGGTAPSVISVAFGAGGCGWLTNGSNGSTGGTVGTASTGGDSPNPSLTGAGAGGTGGGPGGGPTGGIGGFGGGGGGQIGGTSAAPSGGGAGGGGGYSGGGGGIGTPAAGGGGGGSYCSGAILSITATNTGNGLVVITACSVGAITGNAPLCVGSAEGLTDASSGGTWISTNTSIATINGTGNVGGVAAGTDTILYVLLTACGTMDTATAILNVNPLPIAGTITGADSVCMGQTVTLSDATTGGTWSSSSNTIATVAAGVVIGVAAGMDNISYTVSNSCGMNSVVLVMRVNSCVSEVNAIAASSDQLIIYPNPASEELIIKMSEGSFASMTISNGMGQVLMEQQMNASQTEVNIKSLPSSAVYYITFRGQNGIIVRRFIKM